MAQRTLAGAAFVTALFSTAAAAETLADFNGLYILGDSLSDVGNVFALSGGDIPPDPPYFAGRFSNGPVWADYIADDNFPDEPAVSYAFGTARALTNDDPFLDLSAQLNFFLSDVGPASDDDASLVALWFGGNDLFGAIGGPDADAVARNAATAIGDAASTLALAGFDDILLFNLPDLGGTPRYNIFEPGLVDEASEVTAVFNAALGAEAERLAADDVNVTEIDIAALFDGITGNPGAFGFTDVESPCVIADDDFNIFSVCDPDTADTLLFFDGVHPTTRGHRLVADAVQNAFVPTPVPLPATGLLLLCGLGGLFVAKRRR